MNWSGLALDDVLTEHTAALKRNTSFAVFMSDLERIWEKDREMQDNNKQIAFKNS